jgi:TPR repeat protein
MFASLGTAGYRAALADLGMLLSNPLAEMLDARLAVSLYEQAWNAGVTIAAFQLGTLYEQGMIAPGRSETLLAADETRAWVWYQKGADAGEPSALARFAGRADDDDAAQNSLLEAFKYYSSAAERARSEDWPDSAWRDWRYRRASLARLLERAGMMQEVANEYDKMQGQYTLIPTIWQRLVSAK